jgi:hypothetical protein
MKSRRAKRKNGYKIKNILQIISYSYRKTRCQILWGIKRFYLEKAICHNIDNECKVYLCNGFVIQTAELYQERHSLLV